MPLHLPDSIRLIATDMDGTLTRRGKFSPELLTALLQLQQAGILVIVVTGRSAGWVNGVVSYLPVAGAIAENGGLYDSGQAPPEQLLPLASIEQHRAQLAQLFKTLQQDFPEIQPSIDNPFRLTDWTFDIGQLTPAQLQQMADRCAAAGWGFTYSTVQCHLKAPAQGKSAALQQVLQTHFPDLTPDQVLTVGDSPNDESLFDPTAFPHSVGVANVQHYRDRLRHYPAYITQQEEVAGFCEIAQALLRIGLD